MGRKTWCVGSIHSVCRSAMGLCGVCNRGSDIAHCSTGFKLHVSWLCKRNLQLRIARCIVSTMDNGIDATVDRTARIGALVLLETVTKKFLADSSKILDNRLSAELQAVPRFWTTDWALNCNQFSTVLTPSSTLLSCVGTLFAAMLVTMMSC